jgi:hypothetical protein
MINNVPRSLTMSRDRATGQVSSRLFFGISTLSRLEYHPIRTKCSDLLIHSRYFREIKGWRVFWSLESASDGEVALGVRRGEIGRVPWLTTC